jgi:hypothetical protein
MYKAPFTLSPCHLVTLSIVALSTIAFAGGTRSATTRAATRSATTTSKPASTTAAKPAIDRSSPEKTWTELCLAAKAGNLTAFRACCYNKNEISKLFMDAYSDTVVTTFQLGAAVAALGAEGEALKKDLQSACDELDATAKSRKLVTDGDTAKWVRTASSQKLVAEQVMYFKKVGSEWLLDTENSYDLASATGRKDAEDFIKSSEPTLKALKTIITDIKTKKITTVAQIRARLAPPATR